MPKSRPSRGKCLYLNIKLRRKSLDRDGIKWIVAQVKKKFQQHLINFVKFTTFIGYRIEFDNARQWRIQDFPEEGAPTYDFAIFSQKMHEIERIWALGGAHPSRPLRSTTARWSYPWNSEGGSLVSVTEMDHKVLSLIYPVMSSLLFSFRSCVW